MARKKKNKQNGHIEEKENDIDNGNEGVIAMCPCGTQMKPVQADTVYESFMPVFCNDCWKHIPAQNTVYHCPRDRCWDHLAGYDICELCARKKMPKKETKKSEQKEKDSPKRKVSMKKLFHRKNNNKKMVEMRQNENGNEQKKKGGENMNISPTLQSILTQQLFLQNNDAFNDKLSHISVIDELTRLSALSASTLSQLSYANKNDDVSKHSLSNLREMIIKYNALQQIQEKLSKSIKDLSMQSYGMIEHRLLDWRNWSCTDLADWILSLDEGRFEKKYCVKIDDEMHDVFNVVKESIIQQNICGKHLDLNDVKKSILMQSLGINDFDDRMVLIEHINNLINGTFKYHQLFALIPPKNDEIPGKVGQDKAEDLKFNQEENEDLKLNESEEIKMDVEVEGVNFNK